VPVEADQLESALSRWISIERFTAFPKIGGVGLNEMSDVGKMLVIFVLDDKDTTSSEQTKYLILNIFALCKLNVCSFVYSYILLGNRLSTNSYRLGKFLYLHI
jgi:hypothetical protein